MPNESVMEVVRGLLPLWPVFSRIDTVCLKYPGDEVIHADVPGFRNKVRDVQRLPIDRTTAPAKHDAHFMHQGIERTVVLRLPLAVASHAGTPICHRMNANSSAV